MSTQSAAVVQRLWNYCNVLRDDGVSYGDYVEQLTYLLFLKMADEQEQVYDRTNLIPVEYSWETLRSKHGDELEAHYRHILVELGKGTSLRSTIFRKAQNRIQDPAKLRRLIDLIDDETWISLTIDVKGDIYEGLLEKNAQDTKSGAGQYFTPRPLIQAIVDVMRPGPSDTICDPACGTGGFLLGAHEYITRHHKLNSLEQARLDNHGLRGWEIVDNTARLCLMNLYLHGIGIDSEQSLIHVGDSLNSDPGARFSMVLSNPPFGKKSSITIINDKGESKKETLTVVRDDFLTTTSNKQLNFVQHIKTILAANGRAAVVLPDNVLFEGGAGEAIRRRLLHDCDLHTILRLPTGIFYAQGVKANVLFFDKKPLGERAATSKLWIYDLRTNQNFTLKERPLIRADLDDFVRCYKPENRHERQATWSPDQPDGRWRMYTYEELLGRDKVSLDIFWLRDESLEDSANLPAPDILANEIIDDLQAALEQFSAIAEELAITED